MYLKGTCQKKIKVCMAQTNFSCTFILSIFFSAFERKPDKENICISMSIKMRNIHGNKGKRGPCARALSTAGSTTEVTSKHFHYVLLM